MCKIGMVAIRQMGLVVFAILAVILLACLTVVWRSFSTEEDGSQREQKTSGRISIVGDLLPKQQQKPKRSAQASGDKPNNMKTPVNEVVSAASKSAMDSFVVHRHVPPAEDAAQYASDLNDEMDEMLNRSEIPTDYAKAMVALFRDKSLGDVVRDFAVQHIGLYAETLNMRGKYDADSREAETLRGALWDAADEPRTIVAAAAFRALADMATFDPSIDANRLDSRLASCIADSSASPAARVMAAQLCGERRVVAAKPVLERIAADRAQPEPLRLAAANSAKLLAE